MIKRVIILFLVLNFAAAGIMALQKYFAAPEERYSEKAERREDLVGYWISVPLPNDMREKINAKDPWPATPYHALALYGDGLVREVKSAGPFSQTPAELKKSLDRIKVTAKWELANGNLTVRSPGAAQPSETWSVFLVTKPHEKGAFVVKPGDMLMLLTNELGQPVYYRHIRKISD